MISDVIRGVAVVLHHLENHDPVEAESTLEIAISRAENVLRDMKKAKEEISMGQPEKAETILDNLA